MKWQGVKDLLYYAKDICEDGIDELREYVISVADKTRLQRRITAQRKELNAMYAALGRDAVISFDKEADMSDGAVSSELCDRIRAKEEVIDGLERQLRIVAGQVICPSCGRFISERYSFCPYCGKRMGTASPDSWCDGDVSNEELAMVREIDDIDIS